MRHTRELDSAQEQAIHIVADSLLGVAVRPPAERGGPLASFLFAGLTGVGKTELARCIGRAVFGDERTVIFDMGDFQAEHSVDRLVGAPPGYVGHEQGGELTEAMARHGGACVIVCDEAEKAHVRLWDALLGLLDRGEATDGRGRTINFRQSIVVLTTNLRADEIGVRLRQLHLAHRSDPDGFRDACAVESTNFRRPVVASGQFRAEFLNRIDAVALFGHLGPDVAASLLNRFVDETNGWLTAQWGIHLTVSDAAREAVVRRGYTPEDGARGLRYNHREP